MFKPSFKIKKIEEKIDYGRFIIEPLEQGYGQTLGNALRRVLLSSLQGAAIVEAKIDGVKHRFSTIKGVKEDVVDILLNFKQIRIKFTGKDKEKLTFNKKGPGKFEASDIKAPASVKIINLKQKIATLADKKTRIKGELIVKQGYGYSLAEERKAESLGIIPLDAIFSPVTRVNYRVEATRVGRRTDLDKLILEIWTDGTIKPKKSLEKAAAILVSYFKQVVKPVTVEEPKEEIKEENNEVLKLTVEELGLATRVVNALRKAGFKTVADLVKSSKGEIFKVKNLGTKSLGLIAKKLETLGVNTGENYAASKEK